MDLIFHEKQEGSLCAQHCLNVLLQGPYFNPVDLASIGRQLDEAERTRMAEGGIDSAEYNRFVAGESSNVDDSGFFSVQVIESALSTFGLRLVRFDSPQSASARANPTSCKAFICNLEQHWLTIRKLGHQWFNLNSLLTNPHLLSDMYLSMYLEQLRAEGYSIFVVEGELPACASHDVLLLQPAVQHTAPALLDDVAIETSAADDSGGENASRMESAPGQDQSLSDVLEMSRQLAHEEEQRQLQAALDASCTGSSGSTGGAQGSASRSTLDESAMMRQAVQASLDSLTTTTGGSGSNRTAASNVALLSGNSAASPATEVSSQQLAVGRKPPVESAADMRQKRLAYFDRQQKPEQPPQHQHRVVSEEPGSLVAVPSPATDKGSSPIAAGSVQSQSAAPVADLMRMSEDEQLEYALAMSQQQ